jgi:UDP-2,4-diacetamido-2,4,6-trideoxy-beta-L-altropyranose hydrolase
MSAFILFRADATAAMGTGHVMRCLTLAEALRDHGIEAAFACAALTPSIERRLAAEGVAVRPVDVPVEATLSAARELGANALVVDGYQFDPAWRRELRRAGVPILAFQDMDDGLALHADLVLNAAADPADARWRRAAPEAQFLAGPRYVMLRRELRRAMAASREPIGRRSSVLVTFGGADPAGLTLPATAALDALLPPEVAIDVVIGGSVPDGAELAARVGSLSGRVTGHLDPLEMGPLINRAGLAVSAAGGTIGELAALGVPALIVVVAENQVAGAAASVAGGWCEAFDGRGAAATGLVAGRAAALWADAGLRGRMADRTMGIIDTEGAERVANALIGSLQTIW